MKRLALAAVALAVAMPALAQTPEPPPPSAPRHAVKKRWFVGGGFGASFGTVDSIMVAPLVGIHVLPRFDVGTQLYYRWVDDARYSPHISTNDYGTTLFARVRVISHLFAEADYQYTNYEYYNGVGTARSSYSSFLAGGGYAIPLGHNASFYVSALYDFGYDANDPYRPYDNPWRVQIGAAVGF